MAQLVLTDEQVLILKAADGKVDMVNSQGEIIAVATRPLFTPEEIATARRVLASGSRRYSVTEKRAKVTAMVADFEEKEARHVV